MFKHIIKALLHWAFLVAIRLPLMIIGLFAVALGLMFQVVDKTTERPFTQHNIDRMWWHVGLPRWLWLWSNDRDGAKGDRRGWWDKRSGDSDKFFSKWKWMALRNPVNNMRWVPGISVDMYETSVVKLGGQDVVSDSDDGKNFGWHFLRAQGPKFSYYVFRYISKPWWDERVFVLYVGHKIKMIHNDKSKLGSPQKAWKGFTFRINPFLKYKE